MVFRIGKLRNGGIVVCRRPQLQTQQQQIDRLSDDECSRIAAGTPDDWARQTLDIARRVYAMTPAGTRISYAYLVDAREIVERQLEAGGLRLAWLLTSIYDK